MLRGSYLHASLTASLADRVAWLKSATQAQLLSEGHYLPMHTTWLKTAKTSTRVSMRFSLMITFEASGISL